VAHHPLRHVYGAAQALYNPVGLPQALREGGKEPNGKLRVTLYDRG
jgi:hypothetical protein